MGQPALHAPAMLIMAVTSRHAAALAWAAERARAEWGPLAAASEPFDFVETDYYQATMGHDLKKQFLAGSRLIDPAELAPWKLQTNLWEAAYASMAKHVEPRPLNLDPGYLTPAKLVLASTKDHSHRIYLQRGIYAEVTLYYKAGRWQHREWTYPDYRRDDFQAFFTLLRDDLQRKAREGRPA
ncbi:MAG TPA: DUF4416 family protein [Pirellulales bacterium]|nr:DUF4416 family protein [Pirellulales bacterium]